MKKILTALVIIMILSLTFSCRPAENPSEITSESSTQESTLSDSYSSTDDSQNSSESSESTSSESSQSSSSAESTITSAPTSTPTSTITSAPTSTSAPKPTPTPTSSVILLPTPTPPITPFANFITRSGDKLFDGSKEFRFVGINPQNVYPLWMPGYPEWTGTWRVPDDYELEDIVRSIAQMGGTVLRHYALSTPIKDGQLPADVEPNVISAGKFSEAAFERLDKLFYYCNKYKVRVILGLVDYQDTLGGVSVYAGWRGKSKEEFFTDPQVIADFKLTIDYVTQRYKNEKALLCWETGNEFPVNAKVDTWTRDISAYIKSKDPNHLVADGRLGGYSGMPNISPDSLVNPNVDIVVSHYYHWVQGYDYVKYCNDDRAISKGKKVFVVEEFGYAGANVSLYTDMIDAAIENGTSGVLLWSLAHRNKNGGFYWHEGSLGGSVGNYWTYHWPGFFSGASYNEIETFDLLRDRAYKIRGLSVPKMPIPDAPLLLPINDVRVINWRGSTGARYYDIERSEGKNGPWTIVGTDVSDAVKNFSSLFDDFSANAGTSYYYRVIAKNTSGSSLPSNVVGPVKAK